MQKSISVNRNYKQVLFIGYYVDGFLYIHSFYEADKTSPAPIL